MTTVKEIYDFIDSFAPFGTQFEWDNAGLLIGDAEKEVTKTAFALDATVQVIEEAAKNGCDLLVTHHPVIFTPIKSVSFHSPVAAAIKNGISVICAHTNLDVSENGVNTALLNKLGLENCGTVTVGGEVYWTGEIPEMTSAEFARFVSKKLGTPVKYSDCGNAIKKVAVCGGAAGEYLYGAAKAGMDAFVTGEVHHHEYLDSQLCGISVFCAGHFETENPVVACLEKAVREHFDIETTLINQKKPTEFYGE